MVKNLRSLLGEELETRFIEHFVAQGFVRGPVPPDGKYPPDARSVFPLGGLSRERGGDLERIDIQFDHYRRARFVVHFGVIPEAGIATSWGVHVDRDSAIASDAPEACTLYGSSFRMRVFKLGLFAPKAPSSIMRLVDRLMRLTPEFEAWFASRKVGPHVRVKKGVCFPASAEANAR